jgi:hypothetical protein
VALTAVNALAIAGICLLLGVVGFAIRKKFPRGSVFLGGITLCGAGLWMVVSTLELAEKGLAHAFSRKPGTFSENSAPEAFEWSYWFHLGLGLLCLLGGVYMLVVPFSKRGRRIRFEHEAGTESWSVKGVLRLLGLSLVLFVFIGLWKRFVG